MNVISYINCPILGIVGKMRDDGVEMLLGRSNRRLMLRKTLGMAL